MNRVACDDFRQFIDAYLDAEFDGSDRASFDAHVAACPECRQRLEHQVAFRRALRPHLKRPARMPEEARARLQTRLRVATRPARAAVWVKRLAVPVPALATVGLALTLLTGVTGFAPVVDEAAEQHVQTLPVEIATQAPDEAEDWFRGKIPFEVTAPRFRDPRMQLLGGRLSHMGGREGGPSSRRAAYLIYGMGRHKVTVLVFDSSDLKDLAELQQPSVHQKNSLNVAVYHRGPVAYAVTSDLPSGEIQRLLSETL